MERITINVINLEKFVQRMDIEIFRNPWSIFRTGLIEIEQKVRKNEFSL